MLIYMVACVWASGKEDVPFRPMSHGMFVEIEKGDQFLESTEFDDGSMELRDKWGPIAESDSCGKVTILDSARYERAKGIAKIAPIGGHEWRHNEVAL